MRKYLLLFLLLCASAASAQTIADKLTTINNIKLDIKAALASKSQTVGDDFSVYDDAVASITSGTGVATYDVVFAWGGGHDWTTATTSAPVEFYLDYAGLASSITDVDGNNLSRYNLQFGGLSRLELPSGNPGAVGTYTRGPALAGLDAGIIGQYAAGVNAPNGRTYLIPSRSNYIMGYSPQTRKAYNAANTIDTSTTVSKFNSGTLMGNGKILCPTLSNTSGKHGIFDTITEEFSETSYVSTLDDNAFFNSCLLPNGKVLMLGGTGRLGLYEYDPVTDSEVKTATMTNYLERCQMLPDSTVLMIGSYTTFMTYAYTTKVATAAEAIPAGKAYMDMVSLPDGRILLVPGTTSAGNNCAFYDISLPAGQRYYIATESKPVNAAYQTGCLMPDGNILLVDKDSNNKLAVYNIASDTYTEVSRGTDTGNAWYESIVTTSGDILLIPYAADYLGIYDNGFPPVPTDAAIHPLVNGN